MEWMLFAFLAASLWISSQLSDKLLLEHYFSSVMVWVVFASLASLYPIIFLAVTTTIDTLPPLVLAVAILSGMVKMISYWAYAKALEKSFSDIVAALWQTSPVYIVIGAYLLLGERLYAEHYIGGAVIILATIILVFPWHLVREQSWGYIFKNSPWGYMQIATIFWAITALMFGWLAKQGASEESTLFYHNVGNLMVVPMVLVFSTALRKRCVDTWKRHGKKIIAFEALLEGTDALAIYCYLIALTAGPVGLVSAIVATQPIIAVAMIWLLNRLWPKLLPEDKNQNRILKFVCFLFIMFGVYLLQRNGGAGTL